LSSSKTTNRAIDGHFEAALSTGILSPILGLFRERKGADEWKELDQTLCFEVRHGAITLYYRGAKLFSVGRATGARFWAETDVVYQRFLSANSPFQDTIATDVDCAALVAQIPLIKAGIDAKLAQYPAREREIQQEIIRCNNRGLSGRSSDVYFCDQEYAIDRMRADLVGVLWPSNASRRSTSGHRFVWAEVKQGDGAIGGDAGIDKHLRDLDRLLGDSAKLAQIKQEMAAVFQLKQALGLVNCGKGPESVATFFSDEKPLVLIVIVDHDPAKTALARALKGASMKHGVLAMPRASGMGYSIFVDEPVTSPNTPFLDQVYKNRKRG
jgi:hypothetical protein